MSREVAGTDLFLWLHFLVSGTLKGYDQLLNMVLDEAVEYLRGMIHRFPFPSSHSSVTDEFSCLIPSLSDPEDSSKISNNTRKLGLVVCRGTVVMTVSPTSGIEEISNPFTAQMAQE